jgi:hypothetical protein
MPTENTRKFYYKDEAVTGELHLCGLTGTASRPVMYKIRTIGFCIEYRLN